MLLGVAALLALASAPGCSPTLPEGEFECGATGNCPTGWRCLLDERCYSPSFPRLEIYSRCEADEDCASGMCLFPFETSSVGQCSTSCTESALCPEREDPTGGESIAGVCAREMGCLAACQDADDCGGDERCVVVPMTQGETACVDFPDTSFSGRETCMGPLDCPNGLFCVRAATFDARGVCTWPCSAGGTCPNGATCEALPAVISSDAAMNPMHACLATCNATPGSCGTLACAPFPLEDAHCVPPGWVNP